MRLTKRSLGLVVGAAVALASCGGDEPKRIEVPTTSGNRIVFAFANDAAAPERESLYVGDDVSPVPMPVFLQRYAADERVVATTISPDGRFLGAIVRGEGAPCPATLRLIDANDGLVTRFVRGTDCLRDVAWNAPGTYLAMRYTPAGASGTSLAVGSVPGFESSMYIVSTGMPGTSDVSRFAFAGDGLSIAWTEDTGLYVADGLEGALIPSTGQQRSSDAPDDFAVGPDGSFAVHPSPDGSRFRVTSLVFGAPQSTTDLTAALAPGDSLGEFALSPAGTHLLYRATIAGQEQLWLVALSAPLGEQRVDAAAPIVAAGASDGFGFNTAGTRFAWIGDDGSPGPRVYAALVATPNAAVALTPSAESVATRLAWTGVDALVYDTDEGPAGGNLLRSVSAAAPLATVTLSDPSLPVPGVDALALCSDGTVVFRVSNRTGLVDPDAMPLDTALYAAQALQAASVRLVAFSSASPSRGIGAFSCQ